MEMVPYFVSLLRAGIKKSSFGLKKRKKRMKIGDENNSPFFEGTQQSAKRRLKLLDISQYQGTNNDIKALRLQADSSKIPTPEFHLRTMAARFFDHSR